MPSRLTVQDWRGPVRDGAGRAFTFEGGAGASVTVVVEPLDGQLAATAVVLRGSPVVPTTLRRVPLGALIQRAVEAAAGEPEQPPAPPDGAQGIWIVRRYQALADAGLTRGVAARIAREAGTSPNVVRTVVWRARKGGLLEPVERKGVRRER